MPGHSVLSGQHVIFSVTTTTAPIFLHFSILSTSLTLRFIIFILNLKKTIASVTTQATYLSKSNNTVITILLK